MSSEIYIGIDFGTSNSYVSIFENGKVKIIPNSKGDSIPSKVAFKTNKSILIGEETKEIIKLKNIGVVFDIKRFLGLNKNDPYILESIEKDKYPFEFVQDDSGKLKIKLSVVEEDEKQKKEGDYNPNNLKLITTPPKNIDIFFYPEEIVVLILKHIKKIAESYLNMKNKSKEKIIIENAVITFPADFKSYQRDLIEKCAEKAGFKKTRLLNEPTAAAFAYGIEKDGNEKKKILVIDIGGGTYDLTLLEINRYNFSEIDINGEQFFGGEDFDFKLRDYFIEKNNLASNFRLKKNLKKYCEEIKIKLSEEEQVEKEIKLINEKIILKITRNEFEKICSDLFNKILNPINEILQKTKISKDEIKDVILVGGTTKIPKIKEIVKNYFPNSIIHDKFDPETIVVKGAAIYAAKIGKIKDEKIKKITMNKILPHSISTDNIVFENGKYVKICDFVIKKGASLPASSEFESDEPIIYATSEDNQTVIDNYIYEGENRYPNQNKLIGNFSLKNIPPKKKGEMKYKFVFKVDINGTIEVEITDLNDENNREKVVIKNECFNQINFNLDLKLSKINDENYEKINKFNEIFQELIVSINNEKNPEINVNNYNKICNLVNDLINIQLQLPKNIEKNNENIENLVYYVKILFELYNKMFNELKDFIDETNIKKNIDNYLSIIANFDFDIYEIIDIFTDEKIKNYCLKFYILYLFNKGKNLYCTTLDEEKQLNIEKKIFNTKKKEFKKEKEGKEEKEVIEDILEKLKYKFNESKEYFSSVLTEIENLYENYVTQIEKLLEEESKKYIKLIKIIINYYEAIILEKNGRDENNNLIDIHNIFDALDKLSSCILDLNDKGNYLDKELYSKCNLKYLFLSNFLEKKMKERNEEINQRIIDNFKKVKKNLNEQIKNYANFLLINYPTNNEEKKEEIFQNIKEGNNELILEHLIEIYNPDSYFYEREEDENLRELIKNIYISLSKLKKLR